MIRYSLVCHQDHTFDAWFRDSAACDAQLGDHHVVCPFCGSDQVTKALMTPSVVSSKSTAVSTNNDDLMKKMAKVVKAVREHVETNCENVGDKFAQEARMIHYGEATVRPIMGRATDDEARELHEEGIDFSILPWTDKVTN